MKSPKLTFDYYNQLQLVQDPQGARQGMGDLPNQEALLKELNIRGNNPTHNYIYDEIGQLVEDRTEGLRINWRVDGKVASISKGHHTTTTNDDVVIQFHYDGLGNRISKETLKAGEATQQTYYTRDAQGNVMAVYGEGGTTTVVKDTPAELTVGKVAHTETDIYARNHITSTTTIADKQTLNFTAGQSITLSPGFEAKQGSNATLKIGDVPATTSKEGEEVAGVFLKEHHIYGSSRLGILAHDKLIIAENPEATNEPTGKKNYELTNHLGNVLSVISDERNGNKPDVIAFNDYYPFGMLLPNRHGSSDKYRYGFNGMEKDDELKGEGNSYDFGARMYDNRIGRWFSPDREKKPWLSQYQFASNNPVANVDPDGNDEIHFYYYLIPMLDSEGNAFTQIQLSVEIVENDKEHTFFMHRGVYDKTPIQFTPYDNYRLPNQSSFEAHAGNLPLANGTEFLYGMFETRLDDYTYLGRILQATPEVVEHYRSKKDGTSTRFKGAINMAGSVDFAETMINGTETAYAIVDGYYLLKGLSKFAVRKVLLKSGMAEQVGNSLRWTKKAQQTFTADYGGLKRFNFDVELPFAFNAKAYLSEASLKYKSARYATLFGDGTEIFARKNLQITPVFQPTIGPYESVRVSGKFNISLTGPQAGSSVGTGLQFHKIEGFKLTEKTMTKLKIKL